jgi:phage terminase large subunit-like protein
MVLVWYEIDDDGRFLYRRGVIRRMKGWGKDPMLAALSLVEACGPCRFGGWDESGNPIGAMHPMPLVQLAAVSEEQTGNTTSLFPGMISPAFKKEFKVDPGKTIIYVRGGKGVIKAVTSSPRALEGPRPSFCVLNETHHWLQNNEGIEMARVIRRNLGKARDGAGRSLEITNAHKPGEGSVAEATYTAVQEGDVLGVWYDSLEAPEVKDLTDHEEVTKAIKIARGDSYWVDPERLYQEIQDPETPEYVAKRFYFNQVVLVDIERWLPRGVWSTLATKDGGHLEPHERIVIGFDGSFDGDATALVAVTLDRPVPFVQLCGLWEKPYKDNNWRVPRVAVMNRLRELAGMYQVVEVAADPKLWVSDLEVLQEEGLPIVEFPQRGRFIIEATQRLYEDIQRSSLEQDGDESLARHMANAWVKDPLEPRIQKINQKSTGYVDAAVCVVMALQRAKELGLESHQYVDVTFTSDYLDDEPSENDEDLPPGMSWTREPKIITEADYLTKDQFK